MQLRQNVTAVGIAMASVACGVLWCRSQQSSPPPPPPAPPTAAISQATVNLVPAHDPWPHARPRFWDIADRKLLAFVKEGFDYGEARVMLRYETAPGAPYFIGHIEAKGLKPNFAYQMKLAGKPQKGSRGWRQFGDDTANSRLGAAGRWWCESTHEEAPAFDDEHYRRHYMRAAADQAHNMYGYLFLGTFVTDENGNADFSFKGAHSYHITWRDEQNGVKHVVAGTYTIGSTEGYGYGAPVPPKSVKLWYEYEYGRPQNVRLPRGTYRCRFLLTEETFHNMLGQNTNDPAGGFWQTVLANEDLDADGKPDDNAANDVVFTIR